MKHFASTILAVLIVSCNNKLGTYKNKPVDEADFSMNKRIEAKHPNLIPMYGDEEKSEEEVSIDKRYIDEMLQRHNGDTLKATKEADRDGWYYYFTKNMDTAMFRFNQSWLISRKYPGSYFGFAAIREYQGLKEESEKYFQMAYRRSPTDSLTKKYLLQIAEINERHRDTLSMLNSYHRVLSKYPKDATAVEKLGVFYASINKPDSALKYYNLTIEFDPEHDQPYINRGLYYFQHQKTKEAISDLSTAIEKNNKSITAYANRANILMFDKQYEKAIADIKECILIDPKYPDFHASMAECYFRLNQKDKGCQELNIGMQKGGQFAEFKRQRGCN